MQPDAALLVQVGTALFGPAWPAALADALGVGRSMVSAVKGGSKPMPAAWRPRLRALIEARPPLLAATMAALRDAA